MVTLAPKAHLTAKRMTRYLKHFHGEAGDATGTEKPQYNLGVIDSFYDAIPNI